MKKAIRLSAFFLGLVLSGWAHAVVIFNTGVAADGVTLPLGSPDPHWSVVAGPGVITPAPAFVVLDQSPFGLYAQDPDSRWVWVEADAGAQINSPYTFRQAFDLTGFDPGTASISGRWGVDNDGSILLNGAMPVGTGTFSLTGSSVGNFGTFHGFSITGGFVAGINTLDFIVTDTGNPGALNVNQLVLTVSAAAPEPSIVALLGLALAGLGWSRRNRLRRRSQ